MCMSSGKKAAAQAAKAQAEATEQLAKTQRAKTTDMVADSQGVIKVNSAADKKKPMYSLRIPLNEQVTQQGGMNAYGLNIPL